MSARYSKGFNKGKATIVGTSKSSPLLTNAEREQLVSTKENWYALLISIVTEKTPAEALTAMGLRAID